MNDINEQQARQAYNEARKASDKLDRAAEMLGFDDVHELGTAAHEGDFDHSLDYGIAAITNAHSYLNNGDLEGLLRAFEEE